MGVDDVAAVVELDPGAHEGDKVGRVQDAGRIVFSKGIIAVGDGCDQAGDGVGHPTRL